jgi:hypothetical protein
MSAPSPHDPRRQQANLRLALILASMAVIFALGFMAKIWLLAH